MGVVKPAPRGDDVVAGSDLVRRRRAAELDEQAVRPIADCDVGVVDGSNATARPQRVVPR
jgi:hypothetical protein